MTEDEYIVMFDENSESSKKDSIPFHRKQIGDRGIQNLCMSENEKAIEREIKKSRHRCRKIFWIFLKIKRH